MGKNLFADALKAEGVTGKLADLAYSIYAQESGQGANPKTSNAGAVGGMQIIPKTFAAMADKGWDINDPLQNARAGIRYIKYLDQKAEGNPTLTAVGYYGGEGAIGKARKGISVGDSRNPNAPDTLQYAQQVVARMGGSLAQAMQSPLAMADSQVAGAMPPGPGGVPDSLGGKVDALQFASLKQPQVPLPPEDAAGAPVRQKAGGGPDPWMQLAQYMPLAVTPADFNQIPQAAPQVNMTNPSWRRKL